MVLVFVEHTDGTLKKSSLEALSYGAALAEKLGTDAQALWLGTTGGDINILGRYSVNKVQHAADAAFDSFDAQVYTTAIAEAVNKLMPDVIVFSHSQTGRAVAPMLSAKLKAGLVSGAVALPDLNNGFTVKKSVFSGKAFANITIDTGIKIITINPNSFHIQEKDGSAEVVALDIKATSPKVKITAVNKVSGEVPLTEAEIIVSGGRGLKGPENWGMLEDLAHSLHAALACSRPVADANWRPHHEHVGQTGIQVAPDLYVAVGISGAIQHLAGVNRSKVIVVINKDAEAPFFKAATYGIVGDAFEIVPKLTAEINKLKN